MIDLQKTRQCFDPLTGLFLQNRIKIKNDL